MDDSNTPGQAAQKKFGSGVVYLVIIVVVIICFVLIAANFFAGNKKQNPLPRTTTPSSSIAPTVSLKVRGLPVTPTVTEPVEEQSYCNSDADCKKGEKCEVVGPLIANRPVRKVCTPPGVVNPM